MRCVCGKNMTFTIRPHKFLLHQGEKVWVCPECKREKLVKEEGIIRYATI